jgi:acetoin utilization deacetylase AcuC-like enzyme
VEDAGVLIYSENFKKHDPRPFPHPENPERLNRMLEGLKKYSILRNLKPLNPPLEDPRIFLEVHSKEYLDYILTVRKRVEWIDPDTYVSPGTLDALKALSGAAYMISEGIESWNYIIILPRPPGHHAGVNGRALGAPTQGFCIFNISALIAQLLSKKGYKIAILDFDAHHGNGTQEIFYRRGDILHVDIHQDSSTIYPGTGFPHQSGEGGGEGTKININLPPRSGDDIFTNASEKALEFVRLHDPDVLIVDAGFDGYVNDNYMVSLKITSSSFNLLGKKLRKLGVKVVAIIEGGYGEGLSKGLPSFASGLLGSNDPVKDPPTTSDKGTWRVYLSRLKEVEEVVSKST